MDALAIRKATAAVARVIGVDTVVRLGDHFLRVVYDDGDVCFDLKRPRDETVDAEYREYHIEEED